MHLIQILLPTTERSKSSNVLEELVKELTARFGGATSFLQSPAEGRWKMGGETTVDEISIVEVMSETIDAEYWRTLRGRLERQLEQESIVIRTHKLDLL